MGESLNRALAVASTEWVARMDADDVMFPERLSRQIDFLNQHPDISVTSCLAVYMDSQGRSFGRTASGAEPASL